MGLLGKEGVEEQAEVEEVVSMVIEACWEK